jgi:hypothetical protein
MGARRHVAAVGVWTAAAAVGCSLFCAPAGAQSSPFSRFDGQSPNGDRSYLTLNDRETALRDYYFADAGMCSDGKRRPLGLLARGEKRTSIRADGSFSYDTGVDRYSLHTKLKHPVPGRGRTTFSGRLASRDLATVTITSTFTAKHLRCQGTGTLTLYRDGTPQEPLDQHGLSSGQYNPTGKGITIPGLELAAPGRMVTAFSYGMQVRCQSGLTYLDRGRYFPFPLDRRNETEASLLDIQPIRVGKSARGRERTRLTVRFFLSKRGGYRAEGRVTTRAVLRSRGRRIRCYASHTFKGRNVARPAVPG